MDIDITETEREEIMDILGRRANEIANFKDDLNEKLQALRGDRVRIHELPGSVQLALEREIGRLRALQVKFYRPAKPEE